MNSMKFNPGFLSNEELVSSFCVRLPEFDSILEMLSEADEASSRHRLVIGPRGSGKTTLLLRVAIEIQSNPEFSDVFFPVVFAEESYDVATSGDFWLEALSRLAEQAPDDAGQDDLGLTLEELRCIRDARLLERQCLATLLEFAERHGKRLVLIVENLDMMFAELSDQDAGWNIRKTLQTEPRILLLAAANSRFEEIDSPDRAFYDLFVTTELRPLDQQECSRLWQRVSGQSRPLKTMRGLEILTGGNPRLISMVSRFGAERSFRDLMEDLLALVDDLTDYFKSHIEALPPQERRVYLGLAYLWEPATARDIAQQARLDTNTCSAQLLRLVRRGVVEIVGGGERRKLYAVTQRLFSIYCLLRRSRAPSPLVGALVRFMEAYYSTSELLNLASRIIEQASSPVPEVDSLQWGVLAQLIELPVLEAHKELILTSVPSERRSIFAEGRRLRDESVSSNLQRLWRRFENESSLEVLLELAAQLREGARQLIQTKREAEALEVCDKLLQWSAPQEDLKIRLFGMTTSLMRAWALSEQGMRVEEMATYDQLLRIGNELPRLSGEESVVQIRQIEAVTQFFRGGALRGDGHLERAAEAFGEVVLLAHESDPEEFNELVANSIWSRRDILLDLGRYDHAIASCEEVARQFGNSSSPALNEAVGGALAVKISLLLHSGKYKESAAAADQAIQFFGDKPVSTGEQLQLAKAMLLKSSALDGLDKSQEAVRVRIEIVDRFESCEESALASVAGWALIELASQAGKRGRHEEAILLASRALAKAQSDDFIDVEANALLVRTVAHLACGRVNSATADLKRVLSRLPKTNPLPPVAVTALIELANAAGAEQVASLIEQSPSSELLRPLLVALHMELGNSAKVPREVAEVAEDIRKNLREGSLKRRSREVVDNAMRTGRRHFQVVGRNPAEHFSV